MTRKHPKLVDGKRKRVNASAAQTSASRYPRLRFAALAASLVFVLAVFFYVGGLTRLSNHLAENAIADRDLANAKAWLAVSEWLSPRDPKAFFLDARIARREGDLQQMADFLASAQRHGYDRDRIERERILGLAQSGRLEGIEKQLNRWLIEGGGETREVSEAYANGLAAVSRFPSALRILRAWHQDYPDEPTPLHRIGRIQEHLRQQEEAQESYRAAIALDEHYFPALYSMGRILLDEKQAAEALPYYERCLAMPEPAAAEVGIARCLVEMGEMDRAAELLRDVVHRDTASIEASYRAVEETHERFVAAAELGKLEANTGNFEEALQWLKLALRKNPRDLGARYSLAVALRGLDRQAEAEAEFQRVQVAEKALKDVNVLRNRIGRNPQDSDARVALGKLLLTHESERTGVFWLRSVLAYDAGNVAAHQALAEHYESRIAESPDYARLARDHRQQAAAGNAD